MPFVFSLVLLVASMLLQSLTAKSSVQSSNITDFQFPQTDEGTPQAVIFGDCWISNYQLLWYGNFRNSKIYSSSKSGLL